MGLAPGACLRGGLGQAGARVVELTGALGEDSLQTRHLRRGQPGVQWARMSENEGGGRGGRKGVSRVKSVSEHPAGNRVEAMSGHEADVGCCLCDLRVALGKGLLQGSCTCRKLVEQFTCLCMGAAREDGRESGHAG